MACDCLDKWNDLEAWKNNIEARLTALENALPGTGSVGGSGACNCECAGLLAEIQAAVHAAAAAVSLTASVTNSVMQTSTGDLQVTANAAASGGNGSASVSFSY